MMDGFVTALGTPLDEMGNVVEESLQKHVEQQVHFQASGLLALGSMGIQPIVKSSAYVKTVAIVAEAAKGQCPVFAGVMDNSITRVMERIDSLSHLPLEGVVATTPYYFGLNQEDVKRFFTAIAAASAFPLYLYDLPGVTKTKINADTAEYLMTVPGIAGIKTGDLTTARILKRAKSRLNPDFRIMYSGLDTFDAAYSHGLTKQLDGMFSCTASLTSQMYGHLANGEMESASALLDDILGLRDTFVGVGIFPGFTYAMNVQGFAGNFSPDYAAVLNEQQQSAVMETLKQIKLL